MRWLSDPLLLWGRWGNDRWLTSGVASAGARTGSRDPVHLKITVLRLGPFRPGLP
jgi:hypothetical protein